MKNNQNPEWNFEAKFDIDHNTDDHITIKVFDEDLGKDDYLGSTSLDIFEVQKCKQLESQWIPLKDCKSGEVLITADFIPLDIGENIKAKKKLF